MKQYPLVALLLTFAFSTFLQVAQLPAAIAPGRVAEAAPAAEKLPNPSTVSKRQAAKEMKRLQKMEKIKAKLKKLFEKLEKRKARGYERNYLILCLIFVLIAVVFFAIGGGLFNLLGSLAFIGAAVLFVLWLLEYTGNL